MDSSSNSPDTKPLTNPYTTAILDSLPDLPHSDSLSDDSDGDVGKKSPRLSSESNTFLTKDTHEHANTSLSSRSVSTGNSPSYEQLIKDREILYGQGQIIDKADLINTVLQGIQNNQPSDCSSIGFTITYEYDDKEVSVIPLDPNLKDDPGFYQYLLTELAQQVSKLKDNLQPHDQDIKNKTVENNRLCQEMVSMLKAKDKSKSFTTPLEKLPTQFYIDDRLLYSDGISLPESPSDPHSKQGQDYSSSDSSTLEDKDYSTQESGPQQKPIPDAVLDKKSTDTSIISQSETKSPYQPTCEGTFKLTLTEQKKSEEIPSNKIFVSTTDDLEAYKKSIDEIVSIRLEHEEIPISALISPSEIRHPFKNDEKTGTICTNNLNDDQQTENDKRIETWKRFFKHPHTELGPRGLSFKDILALDKLDINGDRPGNAVQLHAKLAERKKDCVGLMAFLFPRTVDDMEGGQATLITPDLIAQIYQDEEIKANISKLINKILHSWGFVYRSKDRTEEPKLVLDSPVQFSNYDHFHARDRLTRVVPKYSKLHQATQLIEFLYVIQSKTLAIEICKIVASTIEEHQALSERKLLLNYLRKLSPEGTISQDKIPLQQLDLKTVPVMSQKLPIMPLTTNKTTNIQDDK